MNGAPVTTGRVVLTYGRFDALHLGHLKFLRQLAALGSELIVGCATDAQAQALKGPCQMPYEARRAALDACDHVSRVIAWDCSDQMRTDIVNYNVCTLALPGPGWDFAANLTDIAQVLYLPKVTRPQTYDILSQAVAG